MKLKQILLLALMPSLINAQTWTTVGSGIDPNGYVLALSTYSGNLYAGGSFTSAGGNPSKNIALWNGSSWANVSTGINGAYPEVDAFEQYNGKLCVSGGFYTAGGTAATCVTQWNGTSFSTLGTGLGGNISEYAYCLTTYSGNLYAGGTFTNAGGTNANYIAKWNGSNWASVGGGMGTGINKSVITLATYNGKLYAGGNFTNAGGIPVKGIARWNGTNWDSVGTGGITGGPLEQVDVLLVYNGKLYAGGSFTNAGGVPCNGIARWNDTSWTSVGTGMISLNWGGDVYALCEHNGELYAGGFFQVAGGNSVSNIAKWDGINWTSLGTGMSPLGGYVYALASHNNALYAGGNFTGAGGVNAYGIAKWTSPPLVAKENSLSSLVNIYPNPTNNILHFDLHEPMNTIEKIDITNLFGISVISTHNFNLNNSSINVSHLNNGIYFITITLDDKKIIKKFIKQ